MPRGDKSRYTEKQQRQAEHIEEGYEDRGTSKPEAERRAWATVNKMTGGAKKPGGSGRGKRMNTAPAKKGGKLGVELLRQNVYGRGPISFGEESRRDPSEEKESLEASDPECHRRLSECHRRACKKSCVS